MKAPLQMTGDSAPIHHGGHRGKSLKGYEEALRENYGIRLIPKMTAGLYLGFRRSGASGTREVRRPPDHFLVKDMANKALPGPPEFCAAEDEIPPPRRAGPEAEKS